MKKENKNELNFTDYVSAGLESGVALLSSALTMSLLTNAVKDPDTRNIISTCAFALISAALAKLSVSEIKKIVRKKQENQR